MDICEITTSTALQPLMLNVTQETCANVQQQGESKFICSPADSSVHREIDLQDAEVSE